VCATVRRDFGERRRRRRRRGATGEKRGEGEGDWKGRMKGRYRCLRRPNGNSQIDGNGLVSFNKFYLSNLTASDPRRQRATRVAIYSRLFTKIMIRILSSEETDG
jgi:hypothetical protein